MKSATGHSSPSNPTNAERDDIAALWVARKRNAPLTQAEQASLDRWLACDVRNQGALIRAEVVWRTTDRAAALRGDASWRQDSGAGQEGRRRLSRRQAVAAAAASVTLLFWPRPSREMESFYITRDYTREDIRTAAGRVSLDCYSQIRTYGQGAEHLAGRCVFSFPSAATVTVRGLRAVLRGRLQTALEGGRSSILLLSGEARVRDVRHGGDMVLRPGEEIEETSSGLVVRRMLSADDLAWQTGWLKGVLELSGQPLSEAADIFNRYNRKKIFVHGAARSRIVVGSFALRDPDAFVDAARSLLHIDGVPTAGRIDLY